MMKNILVTETTKQFRKDLERIKRQGKDLNKLKEITDALFAQEKLPMKNRNHRLHGYYVNKWECHIEPDWLLIYTIDASFLRLERTGSHSDLFE